MPIGDLAVETCGIMSAAMISISRTQAGQQEVKCGSGW